MDNFWDLRVNDRLTCWRAFRTNISTMLLEEALTEINRAWDKVPYVSHYLDIDTSVNWPDPWALLAENCYCDLAKALGKMYTLYFTKYHDIPMVLNIYYNNKARDYYYVLDIDNGKYILNLWPNEIANSKQIKKNQLKLVYSYSTSDLALDKY